ncbi:ABC-type branched-chain amino acid transport systems ATPase component [marine actinobacterium PHSC20C1]|nr:ABC-type branched-chain amino acid transport systems ATPase component [marine actinobacterium PHSC20C1]
MTESTTAVVTESILTVSDLSASIDGQQVIESVSFEMLPVGVTALLGRNGVGKTSTLRAILGLIERSGEVTVAGERVDREPTHRIVQRGVGYVPEDREVFASLTVAENLRLAERDSSPNRALVAELFPDLTDRAGQLAGTLSGGQQQMVSLARALVNNNQVLLVDEPTKGLAPLIVMDVARALERAAETVPVLLVEQNLQVVRMLAKKAIVLEGGRVVYDGSAEELLGNEALTKELLGVA